MASTSASTRSRLPSALRLFALQKTTTTTTTKTRTRREGGRGGLMSVRFAVGHGCSSTSRKDWWPPRYVPDVSSSLLLVPVPSTATESRSPSHRTSYIYGISRNLCFDGRQSSDCCRPPYSRFDVKSLIYRNIWLCDVVGNLLRTSDIIRSCDSVCLAILINLFYNIHMLLSANIMLTKQIYLLSSII